MNNHGFKKHDVIAHQQIDTKALNNVDLTLRQSVDQVSNIVFARELQRQHCKF